MWKAPVFLPLRIKTFQRVSENLYKVLLMGWFEAATYGFFNGYLTRVSYNPQTIMHCNTRILRIMGNFSGRKKNTSELHFFFWKIFSTYKNSRFILWSPNEFHARLNRDEINFSINIRAPTAKGKRVALDWLHKLNFQTTPNVMFWVVFLVNMKTGLKIFNLSKISI